MIVFVMLFFVSLVSLLGAFIGVSKRDASDSAAEALGGLWCESVLAEYDLPLQQRYCIFGFYGSERETPMRLDYYANRSFEQKKYIDYQGSRVFLDLYSLNSTDCMKKQMVHVGKLLTLKKLGSLSSGGKGTGKEASGIVTHQNGAEKAGRVLPGGHCSADSGIIKAYPKASERGRIGSAAVRSSLPSSGASGGCLPSQLIEAVKGMRSLKSAARSGSSRYFLEQYLFAFYRDHVNDRGLDSCFYDHEIEYIICGHPSDEQNLKGVKRRIIAVREAMNLMFILQDPEMNEKTLALAEVLAPGPEAAAVQKLLQTGWALAESRNDYELLIQGKKVPLRKDKKSWAVDLESILESGLQKADKKESKDDSKSSERDSVVFKKKIPCIDPGNSYGENYEDYLRFFTSLMGEDLRVLRMMDIIQINMQYGWYSDFLLRNHYCGIEAEFRVNGRSCEIRRMYYPDSDGQEK